LIEPHVAFPALHRTTLSFILRSALKRREFAERRAVTHGHWEGAIVVIPACVRNLRAEGVHEVAAGLPANRVCVRSLPSGSTSASAAAVMVEKQACTHDAALAARYGWLDNEDVVGPPVTGSIQIDVAVNSTVTNRADRYQLAAFARSNDESMSLSRSR
jgi:hypothetical protein